MNNREIQNAMIQISQGLAGWRDVTLGTHRYGGLGIFAGGQEIGRLQRCGLLDVSLTAAEHDVLLNGGRFHRHHTFPDSDWLTLPIDGTGDVPLAMYALGMALACAPVTAFPPQAVVRPTSPVVRELVRT
jgi:Family of unknown function (DUF5519)